MGAKKPVSEPKMSLNAAIGDKRLSLAEMRVLLFVTLEGSVEKDVVMKATGLGRSSVFKALHVLQNLGYLSIEKHSRVQNPGQKSRILDKSPEIRTPKKKQEVTTPPVREVSDYIQDLYEQVYSMKPSWESSFFMLLTRRVKEHGPELVKGAWKAWLDCDKGKENNHHPKVWMSNYWFDWSLAEAKKRRSPVRERKDPEYQAWKQRRRGVPVGDDTTPPGVNVSDNLARALNDILYA